MKGINLLPWRLEQYHQLLRAFLIKLFAVLFFAFALYACLSWLHQQQQNNLNAQQQTIEQQKKHLSQTIQQVAEAKQSMHNLTEIKAISPETVEQMLSLLPQFPFLQGELELFKFNDETLQLNGFCLTQTEFEAIHEFLSLHFPTVKLSQFKPEQGRLLFQFDIPFVSGGSEK